MIYSTNLSGHVVSERHLGPVLTPRNVSLHHPGGQATPKILVDGKVSGRTNIFNAYVPMGRKVSAFRR